MLDFRLFTALISELTRNNKNFAAASIAFIAAIQGYPNSEELLKNIAEQLEEIARPVDSQENEFLSNILEDSILHIEE